MKHTLEHLWFNSFNNTDLIWLDEALNWDDVFDLAFAEYNVSAALVSAFFANSHLFLDWFVKLSFLDVLLISASDPELQAQTLFSCSVWDESISLSTLHFALPLFYHSDYQDLTTLFFYYTPELVFGLKEYVITVLWNSSFGAKPAAVFDLYADSATIVNSEFVESFVTLVPFIWLLTTLVASLRLATLSNATDAYLVRLAYYLNSMAVENRFQFEAAIQTFFFFVLYVSVSLATFDDDQEELLEFFNTMCLYFFAFTLFYYFFKYSMHFFSFLEAAQVGSKSSNMVIQFLRDLLNTLGLVVRFFVLMVRLNLYDLSDDILDSYYIFMIDFDEEEYLSETFFSLFSTMFFDIDNHDDRSFLLEDEMDISLDLFSIYFIIWGKFALFAFFALEEVARVALALFITYLIIFEMNALNRSFSEDTYFTTKRKSFVPLTSIYKI